MTFAINCPSIINENATIECSWIGQEMYRQTRNNFLEIVIYNKLVTGQLDHSLNRGCQLSSIMNEYAVNVLKSFFSFQLKKDAYQVRKTWNFVNVSYGKKIMYVRTFYVLCHSGSDPKKNAIFALNWNFSTFLPFNLESWNFCQWMYSWVHPFSENYNFLAFIV